MIRVDGDVRRINIPALDHKAVHALVYDIMSDKQRRDYEEFLEVDFSFEIPGLARFRVNAFNQNRGAGAVFRTVPSEVWTLEDLGCPPIFFSSACEITARSDSDSIERTIGFSPAGNTSMMRSMVLAAELVCSVPNTRWPVSAAVSARRIVSRSRNSPTRM